MVAVMAYHSLRQFVHDLERQGELKRTAVPVDPVLEVTEICQRSLRAGGPALLFERPRGSTVPLLGNLFGSMRRIARALGRESPAGLREVGRMLAFLREPRMPRGLREALRAFPDFAPLLHYRPRPVEQAPCREHVLEGADVDLGMFPVQHCWPEDAGRLISFGLVITRGPYKERQNIGVYRQQVIGRN